MNFLANPICDKGEILFQLQVNISFFFFKENYLFTLLFFYGCTGFSLLPQASLADCSQRGLFFVVVHGFLTVVTSVFAEHRCLAHGLQ